MRSGPLLLLWCLVFPLPVRAEPNVPSFSCAFFERGLAGLASFAPERPLPIGNKTVIFFRARFLDDQDDPISLEEARATLTEVSNVFERVSFGLFHLGWSVSPVLALTKERSAYANFQGFDTFIADVRQAALAAGIDYLDYDFDIVRHTGVSTFQGGNANLGFRGAQVQAPGAVIIVHELGHNFGLSHANTWDTALPVFAGASPPLPSNFGSIPDPRAIPFDPDSLIGHDSVIGPGTATEYGDAWDFMGSGDSQFSGLYKRYLGWLPDAAIAEPGGIVTTNRIYAPDTATLDPARKYAVRIGPPQITPAGSREYWIEIPFQRESPPTPTGVLVRWVSPAPFQESSLLLDPVAGFPGDRNDIVLPPGQTFSDGRAGIHATVVAFGGEKEERWVEIAVFHGQFDSNHPPALALTASAPAVEPNEAVEFRATASDPNGDALSWRWDFGDGTSETAPERVTRIWRRSGDFVVRCEVTDRKGQTASAHLPVAVGPRTTFRVSGRVLDDAGAPLAGARVHNGRWDPRAPGQVYAGTLSDSTGAYTLTGNKPGIYTNGAFHFGHRMIRRPPLVISNSDISGIDFVAVRLPQVSVQPPGKSPLLESAGFADAFIFSRTGPADQPLPVSFRLGGTALSGRDYIRPLIDRVIIPAGAQTAVLRLAILDDAAPEAEETIVIDLAYPSQAQRRDAAGELFDVYFPGWELADVAGTIVWTQTDPAYLPAQEGRAEVVILDNDAALALTLSAQQIPGNAVRLTLKGPPGSTLALEESVDFNRWTRISTHLLDQSNTAAVVSVPISDSGLRFYRTSRDP